MNLSNLKPAKGSVQSPGKRVGRGQGSIYKYWNYEEENEG